MAREQLTVKMALELVTKWTKNALPFDGQKDWHAVGVVLANEVRRLQDIEYNRDKIQSIIDSAKQTVDTIESYNDKLYIMLSNFT